VIVPVLVVLLRLVVLRRVLGFCTPLALPSATTPSRIQTYWPLRRLCCLTWLAKRSDVGVLADGSGCAKSRGAWHAKNLWD
jgi:hypothetical protein